MYRGRIILIVTIALSLFLAGCGKEKQTYTANHNQDSIITDTNEISSIGKESGEKNKIVQPDSEDNNLTEKKSINEDKNLREKKSVNKEVYQENVKSGTTISSNIGFNQKFSWSVVRKKDHLPPGLERKQVELAMKYNAIYLGDTSKKTIYLTFDEGYENGYTPKILDTLKENNVKAAFFITMPYLKKHFDLVDRMVKEGHIVGNHTVNHPSMPDVEDDSKLEKEMLDLDLLFREKTGQTMKYLRPPKGEFSERTLKISKDLGYKNVFWSFAYDDWHVDKQRGAEYARKIVGDNIHNGAVLLLHAVSKDNAEALDTIIKDLKAQGYTFGTLEEIE